jgi:hypothetical protein
MSPSPFIWESGIVSLKSVTGELLPGFYYYIKALTWLCGSSYLVGLAKISSPIYVSPPLQFAGFYAPQPNHILRNPNHITLQFSTHRQISTSWLRNRVKISVGTNPAPRSQFSSRLSSLLTVNFLKKERLYTKLKYSRSPAYDIVSGGSAALLAGFIGFLIQEKYGFEMVDSGDFYYLFMYLVFFTFSFRPLLISTDVRYSLAQFISLRLFRDFYLVLFYLALYCFIS